MAFTARGSVLAWSILVGLGCLSLVGAIPIPSTYDGFVYPAASTPAGVPVVLEAFIDPLCSDCKTAWPTITQVLDAYGPSLVFIVHTFPAPFHHNAFFSTRALHIASALNSSSTFPMLELIFQKQESFLNDATNGETPASVVSRFVNLGEEIGLPADDFKRGFTDSKTDQAARIAFKYGCARYVTSTPSFLVNGISIAADETWTLEQWTKLLDPVIYSGSKATT